ncbi:hypothetical protein CBF23_013795 [Marinomonas agarivorans]|nr:hypothetical protein CBF23_013795 [Marinomonas agarivorans]
MLSIVANNATLTVADKTYLVEFEGFNSWRLTARLIHQETSEEQGLSLPFLWRRIPKMLLFTKLLFTKRSRYIGIYYSTLDAKSYAYLRSFAAYQCFTKSRG